MVSLCVDYTKESADASPRRQAILEEVHDEDTMGRGSQEIIEHDRAAWYGVGLLSR